MKHKTYSIKGKNIKGIIDVLKKEIQPNLEEVSKTGKTFFYVFEKYSFLQNSNMSGILLVDIVSGEECILHSVVAGGKAGLLQMDIFGRENSVLNSFGDILKKICQDNGWQIS